ncbi:WD40/YVTN/BNR-like repeat-containing protein [Pseudomonas gingeri]
MFNKKSLFNAWQLMACAAVLAVMGAIGPTQASGPDGASDDAMQSARLSRSLMLSVVHAGSRLVVVGDRGQILYSDDQARTWRQASVPTRQLLTSVYFVDELHGWAVGHDSQILFSDNGGSTWKKQYEDIDREAPLLDVWFRDTQNGFAIGAYGQFLATRDGGEHWEDVSARLDNGDHNHLNAIAAIKGAGLVIVGEQGSLFRSADSGRTWERLKSPYEGSLFGLIGTAQARTLLVYGLRGNVLRSADFGEHWQRVELKDGQGALEYSLAGASLLDDGGVVLVGAGGSVLRSTDAGQTFSLYKRPERMSLSSVTGGASHTLILAGQGGVHRTDANGVDLALQAALE